MPQESPSPEFFETFELFSNISLDTNGSAHRPEEEIAPSELRWERSSLAMMLNSAASGGEQAELPMEAPSKSKDTYSTLGESLYGLENLRKKRGWNAAEAEEEEVAEEVIPDIDGGS